MVHTLDVEGFLLTRKEETKTDIKYDKNQHPTRHTEKIVSSQIGQHVKELHKTSLVDEKVKSKSEEQAMDRETKKEWAKKWKPTISQKEIVKITGEKKSSKNKCCIQ